METAASGQASAGDGSKRLAPGSVVLRPVRDPAVNPKKKSTSIRPQASRGLAAARLIVLIKRGAVSDILCRLDFEQGLPFAAARRITTGLP